MASTTYLSEGNPNTHIMPKSLTKGKTQDGDLEEVQTIDNSIILLRRQFR